MRRRCPRCGKREATEWQYFGRWDRRHLCLVCDRRLDRCRVTVTVACVVVALVFLGFLMQLQCPTGDCRLVLSP